MPLGIWVLAGPLQDIPKQDHGRANRANRTLDKVLVEASLRLQIAIKNCVFETSKLASTKTLLLKHTDLLST